MSENFMDAWHLGFYLVLYYCVISFLGVYHIFSATNSNCLVVLLQDITDVTVVAACGPPGGGRNPVSPRLLKNFW